jgi:putative transcriptional regulator
MKSLKGQLLIATPHLIAPFFTRSVILMLAHDEQGALGVMINHPIDATVSDIAQNVFDEPFAWDKPLLLGGPVTGPLRVIHTQEGLADDLVIPGVYDTIDASQVQELIRQRTEPSLIVANYSGWGPGQLEGEFDVDSWLTLPATVEYTFWDGKKDLWDVVVQEVNAKKLSDFLGLRQVPPDPSLN